MISLAVSQNDGGSCCAINMNIIASPIKCQNWGFCWVKKRDLLAGTGVCK